MVYGSLERDLRTVDLVIEGILSLEIRVWDSIIFSPCLDDVLASWDPGRYS